MHAQMNACHLVQAILDGLKLRVDVPLATDLRLDIFVSRPLRRTFRHIDAVVRSLYVAPGAALTRGSHSIQVHTVRGPPWFTHA